MIHALALATGLAMTASADVEFSVSLPASHEATGRACHFRVLSDPVDHVRSVVVSLAPGETGGEPLVAVRVPAGPLPADWSVTDADSFRKSYDGTTLRTISKTSRGEERFGVIVNSTLNEVERIEFVRLEWRDENMVETAHVTCDTVST